MRYQNQGKRRRISRIDTPEDISRAISEQNIYGIAEFAFQAWKAQRDSAIRRGIPWRFGLFEWDQWWKRELIKLGPDAKRGRRKGQFLMARIGDQGAYEHDNVYAATAKQNSNYIPADVRATMKDKCDGTLKKRGKTRGEHLRLGNLHPCAKPVTTPLGNFLSIRLASTAHGISERGGRYRLRKGEWTLSELLRA